MSRSANAESIADDNSPSTISVAPSDSFAVRPFGLRNKTKILTSLKI